MDISLSSPATQERSSSSFSTSVARCPSLLPVRVVVSVPAHFPAQVAPSLAHSSTSGCRASLARLPSRLPPLPPPSRLRRRDQEAGATHCRNNSLGTVLSETRWQSYVEQEQYTPLAITGAGADNDMKLINILQLSSALFALSAFAGWAQAVNPAVIRGREFVDTVTNQRLQIVGVEYVGILH